MGDYRYGKRLNMRRIIPYIASDYRKDKIWMRRTKKGGRNYQICIAIDDSSSMRENKITEVWLLYFAFYYYRLRNGNIISLNFE